MLIRAIEAQAYFFNHRLRIVDLSKSLCYHFFMLSNTIKTKISKKFSRHEKDTGSAEVQIALFSEEIEHLAKHLKKHAKDNSSRTGLLKMVAKRRRLLGYLKNTDPKKYEKINKELGLKG